MIARYIGFWTFAAIIAACASSTSIDVDDPIPPAAEGEEKKRIAESPDTPPPPRVVELDVETPSDTDSDSESGHPRLEHAAVPAHIRSSLTKTSVPVLLPAEKILGDEGAYERASFIAQERWYSFSFASDDGLSLELRGVSAARAHRGVAGEAGAPMDEEKNDPEEPTLGRAHGIVDLAFSRFGAGYALQVECADPAADARCVDDEFIFAVFESLALIEP